MVFSGASELSREAAKRGGRDPEKWFVSFLILSRGLMNCLLVFACISRVHRSVLRVSNFLCPEKRRHVVINILISVGLHGFSAYILQCKGYIADLT